MCHFTLRERSLPPVKDRLTSASLAEDATDLVRQTEANTNTEKNLKAFPRFFFDKLQRTIHEPKQTIIH